jgi:hypothetical protein
MLSAAVRGLAAPGEGEADAVETVTGVTPP